MSTYSQQIADALTALTTGIKVERAKIGDLASLSTTAKSSLVAALNELVAAIGGAGASINDTTASTSSVYSSQKVADLLTATRDQILGANINAALDTLKEFQDAIGNDPSFAATTAAALGNRVRFDAVQTLTAPQKVQGTANLGAVSLVQLGDPATDFLAVVNTGLA